MRGVSGLMGRAGRETPAVLRRYVLVEALAKMETFVRVTLVVAAVLVALAALVLVLKLLVVAAIVAAVIVGLAFIVRVVRNRLLLNRRFG
jgi:hypothetical protein